MGFSVKPFLKRVAGKLFLKRVVLQPLRRLITPIGFGDKVIRLKRFLGFSVKPFLKRVAGKLFLKRVVITPIGFWG
ncbi:hypothetical protein MSVAZ_2342 [Methanosarcina vacuolata Z-761]|uniref:Uncharacterized protein n=1 Tax=Methanosarcina vacuolata Z-761 TaxID=1434123 RepID=A0A0E3LHP1_9EURY|nr:hypothetical protein MSVAZ_2342 [Methanosarcina vacuolata Z-761]